jgi:uncharacterized membrane protein YfcA
MSVIGMIGAVLLGLVVGAISGVVGIGGGALLVPVLVYGYGMSQLRAQGTSLATMLLPIGIFACWSYWKAGHVDVKMAGLICVGFAVGGWFGGEWAQHLPQMVLRRGFALVLVVIAWKMAFGR